MTLWIDQNNILHDDMNGEALKLPIWPKGMTIATQAQIDAIRNPQPTAAQFQLMCENALQNALDTYAKSWGYDSIVSAASYSASTNVKFKNESTALIGWRDAVWAWAESLTTQPATIADLLAAMPAAPTRPI